jgi:threonine dehydrogenase-like Zn-dependent dehydrogenase
MKAVAVNARKREVGVIDHPAPEIAQATEVKFRTLEVGICGTDREICRFDYGNPPAGFDHLVLGHEGLGIVTEVGAEVHNINPGDLVVPTVRRPCHHEHCTPCRNDRSDFCTTGHFVERGMIEKLALAVFISQLVKRAEVYHRAPLRLCQWVISRHAQGDK